MLPSPDPHPPDPGRYAVADQPSDPNAPTPGWRRPTPPPPPGPGGPPPAPPTVAIPPGGPPPGYGSPPGQPTGPTPPPYGQPPGGPPPGPTPPPAYGQPTAPVPGYGQPPGAPPGYGAQPGYGGPPPGPPAKKSSKAPLFIGLGVLGLLVLVAVVFVGVSALGGDGDDADKERQEQQARRRRQEAAAMVRAEEDLSAALIDEDTDAATEILEDNPDLLDTDTTAARGEATDLNLSERGVAGATLRTESGSSFTVALQPSGDQEVGGIVLDDQGAFVSTVADVIEPFSTGDYTLVAYSLDGQGGDVSVTVGGITTELLFVDEELDGEIAQPGDVVEYEIDLEEASRYQVMLESDFTLTATDSADEPVPTAVLDDGTIQLDAPSFDTFTLRVVAAEPGGTGSYTIAVTQVPDFEIFNLTNGVPAISPFTFAFATPEQTVAEFGRFKIQIRSGVTLRIAVTPDNATSDTRLFVREAGVEDVLIDDFGAGQEESTEYTADGFAAVEFQVDIFNMVPGVLEVTVERVT